MELEKGLRFFVDTAPIIYFIEEHPIYSNKISELFDKTAEGHIQIITSVITFIEVLTKPLKLGYTDIVGIYENFFHNSKGFTVMDINTDVAKLTAKIRAEFGFKLPDAIQLAIFEYSGCDYFITNDKQLKRYDGSRVYYLGETALK